MAKSTLIIWLGILNKSQATMQEMDKGEQIELAAHKVTWCSWGFGGDYYNKTPQGFGHYGTKRTVLSF